MRCAQGYNKAIRKREQSAKLLPARELWLQRERQRQNAHLVQAAPAGGQRPRTSDGTRRADGRIPLYGLVASTGQSPMIISAFRRPRPPGAPPSVTPSTLGGQPGSRPSTVGNPGSRGGRRVRTPRSSGSRSDRTGSRGGGGRRAWDGTG